MSNEMGKLIYVRLVSVVMFLVFHDCDGYNISKDNIIFKDDPNDEASSCNLASGSSGECVDIRMCLPLLALVRDTSKHELLRDLQCGFTGVESMVCCDKNWNCTSSNNDPGYCIPIEFCSDEITEFPISRVTQKLKNSCGSNEFDVCCSSLTPRHDYYTTTIKDVNNIHTTTISAKSKETDSCEMTAEPPHPGSECCGREVGSNRILGGEVTEIDEYPWLAALEYADKDHAGGITVNCGGSLISGVYVVTAAHCVIQPKPINVRLGDYDIDNPGKDCASVDGGGEDCTDEPVIIPIAKIIRHPDYSNNLLPAKPNDIALIKLRDPAPYTDFIRPICLPTSDFTDRANDVKLKVAGWGVSDAKTSYSPVKRHASVPPVSLQDCFDVYIRRNISLGEGQICAGGVPGIDSCKGDSGGPLMQTTGQTTELVGVISFGFIPCGLENKPAVYTRIYHYVPWIKSVISKLN